MGEGLEGPTGIDCFGYFGDINDAGLARLVVALPARQRKPQALLDLRTYGGSPHTAYKLARLLSLTYPAGWAVFCPGPCKSAGTLVTLGADSVVMGPGSELGPLDVQVMREVEQRSTLLQTAAFESLGDELAKLYDRLWKSIFSSAQGQIGLRLASEVSARMAAEVLSRVYSQLDPQAIGADTRNHKVGLEYARRLQSRNVRKDAVERLCNSYPAHDFVIDVREAAESVFVKVFWPPDWLSTLFAVGDEVLQASPAVIDSRTIAGVTLEQVLGQDPLQDWPAGAEADPPAPQQLRSTPAEGDAALSAVPKRGVGP